MRSAALCTSRIVSLQLILAKSLSQLSKFPECHHNGVNSVFEQESTVLEYVKYIHRNQIKQQIPMHLAASCRIQRKIDARKCKWAPFVVT